MTVMRNEDFKSLVWWFCCNRFVLSEVDPSSAPVVMWMVSIALCNYCCISYCSRDIHVLFRRMVVLAAAHWMVTSMNKAHCTLVTSTYIYSRYFIIGGCYGNCLLSPSQKPLLSICNLLVSILCAKTILHAGGI